MAFWNTTAEEIQEMTALYDEFVGSDPAKAAKLKSLLEWACHQKSCDDAYNNTDFSA